MMFTLRPATAGDCRAIKDLIHQVEINPLGLDWRRFLLAIDEDGRIIGSGQVKPHFDGTCEMASIAVVPERRGEGIARAIIERLMRENPPPLYLTCLGSMQLLYIKFGFKDVPPAQMPPYFKRLWRIFKLFTFISPQDDPLSVMIWTGS
jgi:N-acetylglutamate synthase-like GNAT family acetyltransferase